MSKDRESLRERLQRETLEVLVEKVDEISSGLDRIDDQDAKIDRLSEQIENLSAAQRLLNGTLDSAIETIRDMKESNNELRGELKGMQGRLQGQAEARSESKPVNVDVRQTQGDGNIDASIKGDDNQMGIS